MLDAWRGQRIHSQTDANMIPCKYVKKENEYKAVVSVRGRGATKIMNIILNKNQDMRIMIGDHRKTPCRNLNDHVRTNLFENFVSVFLPC